MVSPKRFPLMFLCALVGFRTCRPKCLHLFGLTSYMTPQNVQIMRFLYIFVKMNLFVFCVFASNVLYVYILYSSTKCEPSNNHCLDSNSVSNDTQEGWYLLRYNMYTKKSRNGSFLFVNSHMLY